MSTTSTSSASAKPSSTVDPAGRPRRQHPLGQRPAPRPEQQGHPTVGLQLTAAGYHRPLHVERAVNARRRLNLQVTLAARAVFGKHAAVTDTRAASRRLLGELEVLANHPAASDVARGIQRAHDRAMVAIDNAEAGAYLGLCDKCKAPMHADPDHAEHRCTTCSKTYDVAQRRETQRHRIRESLLSLREIAEYSAADKVAFGTRLSVKQLEGWVRRRRRRPTRFATQRPARRRSTSRTR